MSAAQQVILMGQSDGFLYRNWQSVAMSSDGTKMVAVVYGGQIYTSTDSGVTWVAIAGTTGGWKSVAMSSDGTKMVAARENYQSGAYPSGVYISTNSGATWNAAPSPIPSSSNNWTDVAISANGATMLAVYWSRGIFISTDSGASWTDKISAFNTAQENCNFYLADMSSDGTNMMVAAGSTGDVFQSTDYGVTWVKWSYGTSKAFKERGGAMSSDGSKRYACAYPSSGSPSFFSSVNGGSTWVSISKTGFVFVATSSDGTKLLGVSKAGAANNYGYLYTSTDSGSTWVMRDSYRSWQSVAMSSDGTKMVAVVYGGQIYTSTDSGVSWVRVF